MAMPIEAHQHMVKIKLSIIEAEKECEKAQTLAIQSAALLEAARWNKADDLRPYFKARWMSVRCMRRATRMLRRREVRLETWRSNGGTQALQEELQVWDRLILEGKIAK